MKTKEKKITPRLIILLLVFIVIVPFLPILISQHWDWWEAWVYGIVYILGFAISRALAARRSPDILAERARFMQHEDVKPFDKIIAPVLGLVSATIPLVAGLEALLDGSTLFSLPVKIVALVIILAGYLLSSYAFIENRFFSGQVRIQTERGQQVISSGPYRWMRHPGYAGGLLLYLASPVFLDSAWAFVPAILTTVITILRTFLEDQTLQQELDGYRSYARRVRYRLLPGIW